MLKLNGRTVAVAVAFGLALGTTIAFCRHQARGDGSASRGGSAAVVTAGAPVETVRRVETVFVTNVVETVVTNVVTVTNRVEIVPPPRILSMRKTAPYRVASATLVPEMLREALSRRGARVVSCVPASSALVEATDAMVAAMREDSALYTLEEVGPADKIASGILPLVASSGPRPEIPPVPVLVWPMSSIDVGAISAAVKRFGGESAADFIDGRPVVRARLAPDQVRELARRGDVRQVERDVQ